MWEWILRLWDKDGRDIKLDVAGLTDRGSPSRDCTSAVAAQGVRKGSNSLAVWLAET